MDKRRLDILPQCLSISFKRNTKGSKHISAEELYKRFVNVNSCYFWNLNLKEVFENLELLGCIKPYCLLIGGGDIYLQSMKIAFKKRLLKAPESFYIIHFGDLEPIQSESILPSQYVSLDESLCYIIYDLNLNRETSSFDMICSRLAEWYPSLQLPPQFLILATLRSLLDAGQVYYTGYGYNIMTTDKLTVAKWLDHQAPSQSTTASDQDNIDTNRTSSISDNYNGDNIANQIPSNNFKLKSQKNVVNTLPVPSMNMINVFKYPSSPQGLFAVTDDTNKRTKTRSAVRQFLSKFKSRHQKSRSMTSTKNEMNTNGFYDDESCYYTFNRSQPVFFSSSADFHPNLNGFANKMPTAQHPQWLWNTSLQSLSNFNSKKSISSQSKFSTQAIHDVASPRISAAINRNNQSQPRFSRHKIKNNYSSKIDRKGSESPRCSLTANDALANDSGVHFMSQSYTNESSDVSAKPRRTASYHRYRSLELKHGTQSHLKRDVTPPNSKYTSKPYQGLTRSFSTRLSSLNPVIEGSKLNSQDNRHVMFQEYCGTMY